MRLATIDLFIQCFKNNSYDVTLLDNEDLLKQAATPLKSRRGISAEVRLQNCKLNTHVAARKLMALDPESYDEKYDNVMDVPLSNLMDIIVQLDDKTLSLPN